MWNNVKASFETPQFYHRNKRKLAPTEAGLCLSLLSDLLYLMKNKGFIWNFMVGKVGHVTVAGTVVMNHPFPIWNSDGKQQESQLPTNHWLAWIKEILIQLGWIYPCSTISSISTTSLGSLEIYGAIQPFRHAQNPPEMHQNQLIRFQLPSDFSGDFWTINNEIPWHLEVANHKKKLVGKSLYLVG